VFLEVVDKGCVIVEKMKKAEKGQANANAKERSSVRMNASQLISATASSQLSSNISVSKITYGSNSSTLRFEAAQEGPR